MLKNITLSAEETLIEAARTRAARERTTLNAQFRNWLAGYAQARDEGAERVREYSEFIARVRGKVRIGRKLAREEMNER